MALTIPLFLVNGFIRIFASGPKSVPESESGRRRYLRRLVPYQRAEFRAVSKVIDFAPRSLQTETIQLPNCQGMWAQLPESSPDRALLYIHGGAYVMGSPQTHRGVVARLMRASGSSALSLDYRLAPEAVFPAWVEDAVDAYRYLLTRVSPEQIWVAGESAGGGLSMALINAIAREGLPQPAAVVVISPWADLTMSGPSYARGWAKDTLLSLRGMKTTAAMIGRLAGVELTDPGLSPALGRFPADAPPLLIMVSGAELLRSDSDLLAQAYRDSGGQVTLHEEPKVPHGWPVLGILKRGRAAAVMIGDFVRATLGDRGQV